MPITIFDGIVLGVALFSAVLAMVRGFSREVCRWRAGSAQPPRPISSIRIFCPTPASTRPGNGRDDRLGGRDLPDRADHHLLHHDAGGRLHHRSRIGALDRTLGFLFGAARGILLVVVAMLFFNWLVAPQQQPVWVTHAKSKPLLDNLGNQLVALLPEEADATILDRLRGKDTTGEGESETPPAQTEQAPGEEAPATNG